MKGQAILAQIRDAERGTRLGTKQGSFFFNLMYKEHGELPGGPVGRTLLSLPIVRV